MGQVIVVANSKGGVGKSTLVVHLAVYLNDCGHHVAVIDADYNQLSASDWLARIEHQIAVFSLNPDKPERERNRELRRLIIRNRENYDYMIVDTKGEAATTTDQALLLADLALIPFQPSGLDYWRLQDTLDAVTFSQEENGGRPAAWLVLNQTSNRDALVKDLRDHLRHSGIPIAKQTLNRVNAYRDAPQTGSVTTRRKDQAAKKHGQAMVKLFRELLPSLKQPNRRRAANA